MKNIAIVGAGGLGFTAAALLGRMQLKSMLPEDIRITLGESNPHAYDGGLADANVNHRTGLEYLKPGHQATGVDCIHGGMTKDLLCGDIFTTGLSNRFWMSEGTNKFYLNDGGISGWDLFEKNALYMRDQTYRPLYEYIVQQRGTTNLPLIAPDRFAYLLDMHNDAMGVQNIVGGYGSTGGTVVMAYDYALKRAAIREAEQAGILTMQLGTEISSIHKVNGKYRLESMDVEADMVLVTAAHQIPKLAQDLTGAQPPTGVYHLNGILYARLPATTNEALRKQVSNVNFVVQGDDGCMAATVLAPTSAEDGLMAIYYPSAEGSQVDRHQFNANNQLIVPTAWDRHIHEGLPLHQNTGEKPKTREERINTILEKAYHFNPHLKGYIDPQELRIRTVFNPDPEGDRRVRQIITPSSLSEDGMVMAMTSPKWTTLELAALTLIHEALERLGMKDILPTHAKFGLGPKKLDIEKISRMLNLLDVPLSRQDALDFAKRNQQPERIVDTNPKLFAHQALSTRGLGGGGLSSGSKLQREI